MAMPCLYGCNKADNLMRVPLETAKSSIADASKSNVEGQSDENPKEDEAGGFADGHDWQPVYKIEDVKDDIDIAYINLGETIKLGQVRYSLKAERANTPLTGYQLILTQDGPY